MGLTYAGVDLGLPTPEVATWVESNIPFSDLHHRPVRRPDWAPVRLGGLYWPSSASKWAEAWMVCSSAQLKLIQAALANGPGGYGPKEFRASHQDREVRTGLWLLSPVPLSGAPGQNQMWLLPLVDDRYWWWQKDTGTLTATPGQSWASLVSALGAQLGVKINHSPFQEVFLRPPDGFIQENYLTVPDLLDRIAYLTGRRLVRGFDGRVSLQTSAEARNAYQAKLNQIRPVMAGGIRVTAPAEIPTVLQVAFPIRDAGVVTGEFFTVQVTAQSLLGNIKTNGQTLTVKLPYIAHRTNNQIEDQDALTALARQWALDWYTFRLAGHDLSLDGITTWNPEGYSTALEWVHTATGAATRVWAGPENVELPSAAASEPVGPPGPPGSPANPSRPGSPGSGGGGGGGGYLRCPPVFTFETTAFCEDKCIRLYERTVALVPVAGCLVRRAGPWYFVRNLGQVSSCICTAIPPPNPCVPGTCAHCIDPPYSWRVSINTFTGRCAVFNGVWVLPYSTPCTWTTSLVVQGLTVTVTLTITAVGDLKTITLTFTASDGSQAVFNKRLDGANCCKVYTLEKFRCGCFDDYDPIIDCVRCDRTPDTWTVTLSDMTGCFSTLNGTYVIPRIRSDPCQWKLVTGGKTLIVAITPANDLEFTISITAGLPFISYSRARGIINSNCCTPIDVNLHLAQCQPGSTGTVPHHVVTLNPSCIEGGPPSCPPTIDATPVCCSGLNDGKIIVACCANGIPVTLKATFAGALSSLGTVNLTWDGANSWTGRVAGCGGTVDMTFVCVNPSFDFTGAGAATWAFVQDSLTCPSGATPFQYTGSGTAAVGCSGAASVVITE